MLKIEDFLKTINGAIDNFQASIPAVQKLIYTRLEPLIKELDTKQGKLLNSVKNLKLIGTIKNELQRIIVTPEYKAAVNTFIDSFQEISDLQAQYFSQFVSKYKPAKVLPLIKELAVQATINDLIGQGMKASIMDPITSIITQNITTGGSYADFNEQLRNEILNNGAGEGSMLRYTRQITTDAINQYAAQNADAIAQDLQFNWMQYVGSLITTSREFCIHLTKKRWVHRSELPTIISGLIDGHQCKLSKRTKLPLGMIPDTTPENFNIRRGGYVCGHQAFWVPDSSVPIAVKNKFNNVVTKEKEPAEVINENDLSTNIVQGSENDGWLEYELLYKGKKIGNLNMEGDSKSMTIVDAVIDPAMRGKGLYKKFIFDIFRKNKEKKIYSVFRSPEANRAWESFMKNLPEDIIGETEMVDGEKMFSLFSSEKWMDANGNIRNNGLLSTPDTEQSIIAPNGQVITGKVTRVGVYSIRATETHALDENNPTAEGYALGEYSLFNKDGKEKNVSTDPLRNPDQLPPILVSKDGWILDGHNRYGAALHFAKLKEVNIIRVDKTYEEFYGAPVPTDVLDFYGIDSLKPGKKSGERSNEDKLL